MSLLQFAAHLEMRADQAERLGEAHIARTLRLDALALRQSIDQRAARLAETLHRWRLAA